MPSSSSFSLLRLVQPTFQLLREAWSRLCQYAWGLTLAVMVFLRMVYLSIEFTYVPQENDQPYDIAMTETNQPAQREEASDASVQALAVVLQHPATAATQQDMCAWLQVCTAWRKVVQQSAASLIDVSLTNVEFNKTSTSLSQLSRVCSFTGWLVKYPGMLRTLVINFEEPCKADPASKLLLTAAKQFADYGVQAAACGAGGQLRLLSYSTSLPPSAGLLAALPAATMTELRLSKLSNSNSLSTLSKLSNLRSVSLNMEGASAQAVNSYLVQLARLRQLTQLGLNDLPMTLNPQSAHDPLNTMRMLSLVSAEHKDVSLQALAVALQHPATAATQRDVCIWLQVCKAWRTVIQQSAASTINVTLANVKFGKINTSLKQLKRISSFAGWLVHHSGLVRSLIIRFEEAYETDSHSQPVLEAAKRLADYGVQAAACESGAPLRLVSYTSTVPHSAGFFAALSAATLTQLKLSKLPDSSSWCTLSQLINLRSVCFSMEGSTTPIMDSCLQQLGSLKQLTTLRLADMPLGGNMQLLPTQLQDLALNYMELLPEGHANDDNVPSTLLDLQHLTCLRTLFVGAEQLADGSSVPPNLQGLHMAVRWPAGGLDGVTDLHQVTSITISEGAAHISALSNLAQLQDFTLYLYPHDNIMQAAAAWHDFPLRCLYLGAELLSTGELQLLMQHVAAATKLTKLILGVRYLHPENVDAEPTSIVVCRHLRALKELKQLRLNIFAPFAFEVQDAQHLTALNGLTNLKLGAGGSGPYLDASTVCLLAMSLTRLEKLSIRDHERSLLHPNLPLADFNMFALPVVGRLTALRSLKVGTLAVDDAQRGLLFLTGLTRLTTLVGFHKAGEAALRHFWATVKANRSQAAGQGL